MKKISKRVRDEAILICAIAASTPDCTSWYSKVLKELDGTTVWSNPAYTLACSAWQHVYDFCYAGGVVENWDAEAECLLREGWSP